MQEIKIDPLDPQIVQAAFARLSDTSARRVPGQHLADDKGFVTSPLDGFADHSLGSARRVHFGSVDQGHAQIEAATQAGNLQSFAAGSSPMCQVPWPRTGTAVPESSLVTGNVVIAGCPRRRSFPNLGLHIDL